MALKNEWMSQAPYRIHATYSKVTKHFFSVASSVFSVYFPVWNYILMSKNRGLVCKFGKTLYQSDSGRGVGETIDFHSVI